MSGDTFAVHAACIRGVEAIPVTVEISMSGSIPGISIIGRANTALQEARARIRCALRSSGFEVPRRAITVNLAPGDIPKQGSGFDFPIAVAILVASGQIPSSGIDDCMFVGELSLDGSLRPVIGSVAYQILARDMGVSLVGAPSDDCVVFAGSHQGVVHRLSDMRQGIDGAVHAVPQFDQDLSHPDDLLDFGDVVGQDVAKRGIAIAAAGELGMLMVGSPGSGKSMLAQRMVTILPPITDDVRQEALCIHSVVDEPLDGLLAGNRPFRAPHHSISTAGLVGGGRPVRPGEISLAHGGVLFLDELAEFPNTVLQQLRQPMEQGTVRLVRADGSYEFPCSFQFLAASNPCPCGFLGDREVACKCSDAAIEKYQAKLRGPLADRIDIVVDVARPPADLLMRGEEGLSTADLIGVVETGRRFREARRDRHCDTTHALRSDSLDSAVASFDLDPSASDVVLNLADRTHMTGRGIVRLCRIARTIADIDESFVVSKSHVLEAALYRGRRGD